MKRIIYVLCFALLAFVTSCQKELAPLPGDDEPVVEIPDTTHPPTLLRVMINGDSALVQLPYGYNENRKYALLIGFAGGSKTESGNLDTVGGVAVKIRKGLTIDTNLIVICPQNATGIFGPATINNFFNTAIKKYAVDTTRLYLTGFKLGGQNVLNYLSDKPAYAARIAAAAPVTSLPLDSLHFAQLSFAQQTKVLLYCGKNDNLFKVNKLYADLMNATFIIYNDNRISFSKLYSPRNRFFDLDIYQSMLQYKK